MLSDNEILALKFTRTCDYAWVQAYQRLVLQGKAKCLRFVDDTQKKKGDRVSDSDKKKASGMFNSVMRLVIAERNQRIAEANGDPKKLDKANNKLNACRLDVHPQAYILTRPIVEAYIVLHDHREESNAMLGMLGTQLPHADVILKIKGLAGPSYASIVAEAGGSILDYENPAKLWKRFGLAVMPKGNRQGRLSSNELSDKDKTQEWLDQGYCPRRRALLSVITENICVMNKDPAYCKRYELRLAHELEQGFKPMHAKNRALRYMSKRLLLNIWRVWHGQEMHV